MNSMVKKHTGLQCMYTEQKSTLGNLMYNKTNKGSIASSSVCLFVCLFIFCTTKSLSKHIQ